jgi:hypothetical protein
MAHTHFFSASKNDHVEIESCDAPYLRKVAGKMRRELGAGTSHPAHSAELAAHIDTVAERKEQEWEAEYERAHGVPYVKKADRAKG